MGIYTWLKSHLLAEARNREVRRWVAASGVVSPAVSMSVVGLCVPGLYGVGGELN